MGIVKAVSFGLIFLLLGAIGYVIMAVVMGLLAALLGIVGILVPEILTTIVARVLTEIVAVSGGIVFAWFVFGRKHWIHRNKIQGYANR